MGEKHWDQHKDLFDNHEGQFGKQIIEMYTYCLAYDERYANNRPTKENECKICRTEYDCGNGNEALGIPPDPALQFCVAPLDVLCAVAESSSTVVPAFEFELMGDYGRNIQRS